MQQFSPRLPFPLYSYEMSGRLLLADKHLFPSSQLSKEPI